MFGERADCHDGELQRVVPGDAERLFGFIRQPDHHKLARDGRQGPVEGEGARAVVIFLDAADGISLVQGTRPGWKDHICAHHRAFPRMLARSA